MTGRTHKQIVKELKRKEDHLQKAGFKKDDNVHGRNSVEKTRRTNTKNK